MGAGVIKRSARKERTRESAIPGMIGVPYVRRLRLESKGNQREDWRFRGVHVASLVQRPCWKIMKILDCLQ